MSLVILRDFVYLLPSLMRVGTNMDKRYIDFREVAEY